MKFALLMSIHVPLCIHCKHYRSSFLDTKYGTCNLFPINQKDDYYLVNGVRSKKTSDYYCSTARGSSRMCGEEGKYYEQK
jgi:hypothetical protein